MHRRRSRFLTAAGSCLKTVAAAQRLRLFVATNRTLTATDSWAGDQAGSRREWWMRVECFHVWHITQHLRLKTLKSIPLFHSLNYFSFISFCTLLTIVFHFSFIWPNYFFLRALLPLLSVSPFSLYIALHNFPSSFRMTSCISLFSSTLVRTPPPPFSLGSLLLSVILASLSAISMYECPWVEF